MLRPPIGVALLGFFALINGVAAAIIGLQLIGAVAFGPLPTGNGVFFTGLLTLAMGVLYIALAYAAWSMRVWAWAFGMFVAVLGLFNAVLVMLGSGSVATGLAAAFLPGVVLWYLNSEPIKQAFYEGEIAQTGFATDYDREQAQRITAERSQD